MHNFDARMPFWMANQPELRYAWTHDPAWRSTAETATRAVADDIVRVGLKQQAKRLYAAAMRRLTELQERQRQAEHGG
jgi:hypothetical protein